MKYISVEKLKAEIKRLEEMDYPCDTSEQSVGFYSALDDIKSFIDSLQQEQPEVDLEKDIEMEWESFNKHVAEYGEKSEDVVWLNWLSFVDVATYFYKLGKLSNK